MILGLFLLASMIVIAPGTTWGGQVGTHGAQPEGAGNGQRPYEIGLPGRAWALEIAIPGFVVTQEKLRPDGQAKMMQGQNDKAGMGISMFLEPRGKPVTPKVCRDDYWAAGQATSIKKRDVVLSESDRMALVKWTAREHQGIRIDQRHLHAFVAREDACMEIHLSKMRFKPADEKVFAAILNTVRFKEGSANAVANPLPQRFAIPAHGLLALNLPQAWRADLRQPPGGLPPTISISPTSGQKFELLITVVWDAKSPAATPQSDEIRRVIEQSGRAALSQAVEKTLTIQEFGSEVGKKGYYVRMTDKAPKPDEYRYMTQGGIGEGNLLLMFTFLTNSATTADQQAVLTMLSSAKQDLK